LGLDNSTGLGDGFSKRIRIIYRNFGLGFSNGLENFFILDIGFACTSTLIAIQRNNTAATCEIAHLMKAQSYFTSINR